MMNYYLNNPDLTPGDRGQFQIGDQVMWDGQMAEVASVESRDVGIILDPGNPDSWEIVYVQPDELRKFD